MNILHLQNYLDLSCGVSRTIYLIIKNSSDQFTHSVICFGGDGLLKFKDLNLEPVLLKERSNSSSGLLSDFFILYSFCKKNEINIIHSHHRYFDFLAYLVSFFLPVKTITSIHSKVEGKKLLSYKSDILIACSNAIKDHLINNFKIEEKRIKVIYNFVDLSEVKPAKTKKEVLKELGIPNNKFIIGFFGRLNYKEKGIDFLLEAFRNLSKDHFDLFLIIIGNGENGSDIKTFIKEHNLNALVLSAREDIFNYYQLLDVFVLPSRVDPFPLVMLEAGYFKIPFIGSAVDGIAELIEDEKDGLLFEPGNSEELQNKILKIINDKKLSESLANNLHQKILSRFVSVKIIPEYQKLYLELSKNE